MVAYAGAAVEGNCTLLVLASCPRYDTYHTGGKSVVENVVVDGIAVTVIDEGQDGRGDGRASGASSTLGLAGLGAGECWR